MLRVALSSAHHASVSIRYQKHIRSLRLARCRVMTEVGPGECGALAATDNCRGFGWAKRYSRREAQEAAKTDVNRIRCVVWPEIRFDGRMRRLVRSGASIVGVTAEPIGDFDFSRRSSSHLWCRGRPSLVPQDRDLQVGERKRQQDRHRDLSLGLRPESSPRPLERTDPLGA